MCGVFIDGTFQKTCRPSYFQRLAYSGHKQCHGIKFQSVVTPDGLYAHFYGPIAGNRHDASLLNFSNLLPKLALLCLTTVLCLLCMRCTVTRLILVQFIYFEDFGIQ